ncbi:MAG: hypothetical protein JHD02_10130 [Thermoleophilaceae bacterium]|nr:hypothetical protein [Thermoleophilaceae bacterium]
MSNLAYETLGRVTWTVGKRRVGHALTPRKPRRVRRILLIGSGVAVGVVAAGAALERAAAQ